MEPDIQNIPSNFLKSLRGAKGRFYTGGLNLGFGTAELIIAIVIQASFGKVEFAPFGTGTMLRGVALFFLSIAAGYFGIYSSRGKCQIVTYLILSIALAISTAFGVHNSSVDASGLILGPRSAGPLHTANTFLVINSIVNALHCVVAIAGAASTSFICDFPETRGPEQPKSVVVQPPIQQPQQPMGVAGAGKMPAYINPVMQ